MRSQLKGLEEAWKSYKSFEEFNYQGALRVQGVHMVEFVGEWEARLQQARAGGCQYSTTVLALKLLGNFKTVLNLGMSQIRFLRKSRFLSRPDG
jgi:hypothetical protein